MNNSSQTIAVLRRYQSVFSNRRTIEPEGWLIYAAALQDLPVEVVKMAMDKLVLTSDWFPSVKEIRSAAEGLVRHSNGNNLPTADEAWAEVLKLGRRYSPDEKWPFSCPEIEQAVRAFGGKLEVALIPVDGVNTARAQFRRAYDDVVAKARDKAANEAVIGMLQQRIGAAAKQMLEAGA